MAKIGKNLRFKYSATWNAHFVIKTKIPVNFFMKYSKTKIWALKG